MRCKVKTVKIDQIVERFSMTVLNKASEEQVAITSDLNRVGLQLAGHFDYFSPERIQIMGQSELSFYNSLPEKKKYDVMDRLMSEEFLCLIITRNMDVPSELVELAKKYQRTILVTPKATTRFISQLTDFLENCLAPTKTVHGVLVDVYGVGVLLLGKSGIGKSETALELIKRGHRLIADDAVEVKKLPDGVLEGRAPELIRNFLEIRGIGILDIAKLYGIGSVRNYKKIELVVNFKEWADNETYDRLGMEQEYMTILDQEVATLDIPVKPGRNLAIILEAAARNHKQKLEGYNAAIELDSRLQTQMNG